ncbi:alpha/beta hydrolase [Temperatibacter marinus]|uniref:Alpha/beta hydrolase n=1 Tax=Temperatibacter marinus TaxID=1456591 RepID=A0AA52EHU5_9PROT|nr:alpha/beta hydrolase [Temperatibacter marinus]WND03913.1 alpha/beta hydrolase [Temperatibacter marinus]
MRQKFEALFARFICALPKGLIRLMVGPAVTVNGKTLDPYVQFILEISPPQFGDQLTPEHLRFDIEQSGPMLAPKPDRSIETTELIIQGGGHDVPALFIAPKKLIDRVTPVLVYFHGGGHVAGSPKSHHGICSKIASYAKCKVISIDYRMAPEHVFPAGIEDCIAAYDYVVDHAENFRIDARKIIIGGDSAGGNIAAILAQQLKDHDQPPCLQMLWVPWVDLAHFHPSISTFGKGYLLDETLIQWFIDLYIPADVDKKDPRISPLYGVVEGVCPAIISTAAFDPLRDEGMAYASKLAEAGVSVDATCYEGLPHPMLNLSGHVKSAKAAFEQSLDKMVNFLEKTP